LDSIEVGVAVADEWQGHGIGRRLFDAALTWARDRGIEAISASCFADNWRVLSLLSSAPQAPTITPADSGVVNVRVPMRGPVPGPVSLPPYRDPREPRARRRRISSRRRVAWQRRRRPGLFAGG
jgi:hypothetical protein